jgi:hypothetical protein
VRVFPGFTRVVPQPSPLVEIVQVDDLPGGTYSLNVANKYNLLVGAGGVTMKSYGVVNISGAVTTLAGEQINLGSAMETNIDGGKRLSMRGDIVTIAQRNRGQVLVDSDLGVTGKTTIRGALYVEGPIYTHEIHSVGKLQQTNRVTLHSAGYPAASPPTPMGTLLTADTAHVKQGQKGEDGVSIGAGTKPVYMGYTDIERPVVGIPTDTIIGHIEVGECVVEGSVDGSFGTINVTCTNPARIPVKVLVPSNVLGCKEGEGLTIGGTGKTHLSLRGLPKEERDRIMTAFSGGDASEAPGVIYGDGSDWDAIKSAPASTTFVGPATDVSAQTNLKLRLNWIESDGIPSLVGHGPQNGEGNALS